MAKDAKWYAGWVRNAYAQMAEEKQTNLEAAEFIEYIAAELEAVRRERDAAVHDLSKARDCCHFCKHDAVYTSVCDECKDGSNFEWRGAQETEA